MTTIEHDQPENDFYYDSNCYIQDEEGTGAFINDEELANDIKDKINAACNRQQSCTIDLTEKIYGPNEDTSIEEAISVGCLRSIFD